MPLLVDFKGYLERHVFQEMSSSIISSGFKTRTSINPNTGYLISLVALPVAVAALGLVSEATVNPLGSRVILVFGTETSEFGYDE